MKPIIPNAALGQHIAVLGKTRSGKSSVMRGLVEGLLEREQPVCIVDPKGDWWGIKLARDGKRPGYPVVIFGGEHADVPINEHAGAHVAELFATGNRSMLIDLGGWMVGERTRFWIDFASALFKHTKGLRWLVVDEFHNFAPKGKIMDPDSGKALHWSNRLASEGLGKGLHLIFASQRPQKVHNDALTSAETLIAMRVLHPSDRGAVSDWIKGCGDLELGAKVLNSLAQMDRGEGWAWSPEIGFGPERVKFPMFKTYDSFRPQTAEDAQNLKGWAEVDLEDVKAKLATVVKEAEAKDPKLLQAEIARLRKANAELGKRNPDATDQVAIAAARQEGREEGARDGYAAGLRAVQPIAERLGTLSAAVSETVEGFQDDLRRLAKAHPPLERRAIAAPSPVQRQNSPAPRPAADLSAMGSAKQRILDALAWLEAAGIDRAEKVQLALLADQSPKSSGYANNLGALRSGGLIDYPGPAQVALTAAGRAAANAPERPPTTEDLHRTLENRLDAPKWRILKVLIGYYPEAIDRGALAAESGQSANSSGYANNLGALRSLGFIDYPAGGQVVALPVLFLEQ